MEGKDHKVLVSNVMVFAYTALLKLSFSEDSSDQLSQLNL
jgi:hypothetical protein